MLKRLISPEWLPSWMHRDHPLVQRHLRKPLVAGLNQLVFGTTFGLFLLFGGLSLPMLYLTFSLIVLVQLAAGTAGKIYDEREHSTWDLIRVAPYSRREVLMSTWAAGFWQLHRTWVVPFYRLLQGVVIVGLMVFGLWLGDIPQNLSIALIVGGTLLIALQPFVDMYFGGMVGLLAANLIPGRMSAQVTAASVVLIYWGAWIALVLAIFFSDLHILTLEQIALVVGFPLLLPVLAGYMAFRLAEAVMR